MSSVSLLRGGVLGISVLGRGLGPSEISIVISDLLLRISIPSVGVLVLLIGVLVLSVRAFFLSSSSYSITSYLVVTSGIRYRAS